MTCFQHPFIYEDDCAPCQADALIQGNISLFRDCVNQHPTPAIFALRVAAQLLIADEDELPVEIIERLIRALDVT